MTQINDPAIIAEVTAVHIQYETALVENDIAVLDRLFWNSTDVVRFGATESLYGFAEIAAFRQARPTKDLARKVSHLKVVSFGSDTAVTTVEFDRETAGAVRHGRQTQVWCRFDEGWKIVSAHVSLVPSAGRYVEEAAALVGLSIPPRYRAGVELNLARACAIVDPLLELILDETVEPAPVFES